MALTPVARRSVPDEVYDQLIEELVDDLESAVAASVTDPQDAILGPGLQYGANPWDFISLAIALKLGMYCYYMFALPDRIPSLVEVIIFGEALSIIGIVYAGLVTLVQSDMKKLIAYSSVSHLGFCMLGMFALNPLGLEGSVLQMINHGLSTGGLFLIVGLIYERRHSRLIADYGGLAHVMPVYAVFTLIIFLASMGLPTLNGFIGEAMILLGAFTANKTWAYWAVSGVVLGAAYLLWLYQRVFWGKVTDDHNLHLSDLNARELATLVPLAVLCFWIGLYPAPFLEFLPVGAPALQTEYPRRPLRGHRFEQEPADQRPVLLKNVGLDRGQDPIEIQRQDFPREMTGLRFGDVNSVFLDLIGRDDARARDDLAFAVRLGGRDLEVQEAVGRGAEQAQCEGGRAGAADAELIRARSRRQIEDQYGHSLNREGR